METVILVIHLLLALSIIGLVLIQRSEGGGLGIGGSGGGLGQFATARSTANALTRATAYCAAGFFLTSLILGALAGTHTERKGILDTYAQPPAAAGAAEAGTKADGTAPDADAAKVNEKTAEVPKKADAVKADEKAPATDKQGTDQGTAKKEPSAPVSR